VGAIRLHHAAQSIGHRGTRTPHDSANKDAYSYFDEGKFTFFPTLSLLLVQFFFPILLILVVTF
jgi:hypothetical protein